MNTSLRTILNITIGLIASVVTIVTVYKPHRHDVSQWITAHQWIGYVTAADVLIIALLIMYFFPLKLPVKLTAEDRQKRYIKHYVYFAGIPLLIAMIIAIVTLESSLKEKLKNTEMATHTLVEKLEPKILQELKSANQTVTPIKSSQALIEELTNSLKTAKENAEKLRGNYTIYATAIRKTPKDTFGVKDAQANLWYDGLLDWPNSDGHILYRLIAVPEKTEKTKSWHDAMYHWYQTECAKAISSEQYSKQYNLYSYPWQGDVTIINFVTFVQDETTYLIMSPMDEDKESDETQIIKITGSQFTQEIVNYFKMMRDTPNVTKCSKEPETKMEIKPPNKVSKGHKIKGPNKTT